jgi:hypothetical protein
MRFARLLILVSLLVPTSLFAWGSKGHAVTAEIAERGLSPNTMQQIRGMNFNAPLREIASMPDDWRADETKGIRPGDTGALHYSNIPNDQPHFDRARDCKDDQCIVAAIEKYTAILKDKAQPRDKRREALIFVVHFLGDLHQPMHAAGGQVKDEQTGKMIPDRGGNLVKIRLLGVETNLHSAWDGLLVDWGPEKVEDYADYLMSYEMRGRSVAELQRGTIVEWFEESHYAAVHHSYKVGNGTLGTEYAKENIGIVYERLLRGGLRLRKVLEDALTAPPPQAP